VVVVITKPLPLVVATLRGFAFLLHLRGLRSKLDASRVDQRDEVERTTRSRNRSRDSTSQPSQTQQLEAETSRSADALVVVLPKRSRELEHVDSSRASDGGIVAVERAREHLDSSSTKILEPRERLNREVG